MTLAFDGPPLADVVRVRIDAFSEDGVQHDVMRRVRGGRRLRTEALGKEGSDVAPRYRPTNARTLP
ncbi:MAG: hypothetical protein H6747_08145 [Deltaproteobacteria bacterium]|nr:hypothetical protein [Deltaproteobacteria bacterium]